MSDGHYQNPHIYADNSYTEYLEAQYWSEHERVERERYRLVCELRHRERRDRQWHRRMWRKLQALADWFDNTFGWFFSPRRYN